MKVYKNKYGYPIPNEHTPNEEDLNRLAKGDKDVVNYVIEGLIGFATYHVDWYIKTSDLGYTYAEDLRSVGLLTLVECVNNQLGKSYTAPQFLSYIGTQITHNINDWLRENVSTITISARTQQYNGNINLVRHEIRENDLQTPHDELFETLCFREFLEKLSERDEFIIRQRLAGYTISEIASDINMSISWVEHRLHKIAEIYKNHEH